MAAVVEPATERSVRGRGFVGGVVAVTAVQAVVIAALALAGYFYLDDVDMIAEGGKNAFGWAYLGADLNDHFAPGPRTVYWLIAHLAPYDHGVTVAFRVLLQAVATLLVAYLLAHLVGPGRLALGGVAMYAFSPLLVPSLLSLSSAVHLLPTHVGVLLLTVLHMRFHVTRRYRYAVAAMLGLGFALLFWEKAVLGLCLPVLLVALYLGTGGPRARLRAVLGDWRAWLLYLVPIAVFFGQYVTGGYPKLVAAPEVGAVWLLLVESWWHTIGPTAVGGPWRWFTTDSVYFGYAAPLPPVRVLGSVALLAVAVIGVRRHGWAALRSWLLVATYLLGTAILLAAGRFDVLGSFVVLNLHYYSELAIPLTLAIVLCLGSPTAADIRTRITDGAWACTTDPPARIGGYRAVATAAVVAAYAVSYAVTVGAFEARWVQNPIRGYLTTAVDDLTATTAARGISVHDAFAPNEVAYYVQSNRRLSEILGPVVRELDHSVTWVRDVADAEYAFDRGGHLVPAS